MTEKTPFKKNEDTTELVKNLDEIFREIQKDSLYGVTLKDVAIGTSETVIAHKLGRNPQGWIIVEKNANSDVWSSSTKDGRFLYLMATAAVTVTLYVW